MCPRCFWNRSLKYPWQGKTKSDIKNISHRFTRGSLRWPKKTSKEMLTREGICMRFWDSPKFEPFSFSLILAGNVNHMSKSEMVHFFSPKILRWPKIRKEMVFEAKMVRILGHSVIMVSNLKLVFWIGIELF